ncbi:MAG: hypothetical protein WBQ17_04760 [Rhizomicrobium sp.]
MLGRNFPVTMIARQNLPGWGIFCRGEPEEFADQPKENGANREIRAASMFNV